jgi:pimeloyl-ACP methyl ester carboxylesterase
VVPRSCATGSGGFAAAPRAWVSVFGPRGSGALITRDDDRERFYAALDEIEGVEWVEPGEVARHPELGEWRNEIVAWEGGAVPLFRPGRRASQIACPVLAQIGTDDHVTPIRWQRRAFARAPNAEVRELPIGHFDVFGGEWFERTVEADVAFFRTTLAARAPTARARPDLPPTPKPRTATARRSGP